MPNHEELRVPGATHSERAQNYARGLLQAEINEQNRRAKFQQEAYKNQKKGELDEVSTARERVDQEIEDAQRQYTYAWQMGDGMGVAKAQSRLMNAEHHKRTLEDGEDELKEQVAEVSPPSPRVVYERTPQGGYIARELPPPSPPTREQVIEQMPIPPLEKAWLRAHPEALNDPERLRVNLQQAGQENIQRGSPEMVRFFNRQYQYSTGQKRDETEHLIMLTEEEQKTARMLGLSNRDYAFQKREMIQAKRQGRYQDY